MWQIDAASQEVLEMFSIKQKVSPISPSHRAWKNGFQGLSLRQPGIFLPSSHDVYQLTKSSLPCSTLLKPPSPFWLFRGVFEDHHFLLYRALCQNFLRVYSFLGYKESHMSNIFLGNHLYTEIKSLHVYIFMNRWAESALWGSFTNSVYLIGSYIIRCFFKSVSLINILSLHINMR